jgi:hypothetical protein
VGPDEGAVVVGTDVVGSAVVGGAVTVVGATLVSADGVGLAVVDDTKLDSNNAIVNTVGDSVVG